MDKHYFFVRHGETSYNKMRIIQGSGVDSELNEVGQEQSRYFYEHYRDEAFDYVICSGLKRTYQTVRPFVEELYTPFEKTSLINEISWGVHEGKKGNQDLKLHYKRMIQEWSNGNFHASLEGAESAFQLSSRLNRFLDYLVSLPHEKVLICTHGRTLRCLLCLMKGEHLREMENYSHYNTGLFQAGYSDGKFIVKKENDVSHLRTSSLIQNW